MTRNRWTWPIVTMLVLSPLAVGSGMAVGEAFPIGTRESLPTGAPAPVERVTSLETEPTQEATMSATPSDTGPTVTKVPTRGSADAVVPDGTPAHLQERKAAETQAPEPTGEPTTEPEPTPPPVPTKAPTRAVRGDDGVWWCYPPDGSDPHVCP